MEKLLNRNIKEVIEGYPEVAGILETFDIGCVPCSVGTCLLSDIVEIHGLTEGEEEELLRKIGASIYPGVEIKTPRIKRESMGRSKKASYSPPMKMLVDEHTLIKRWVALIPAVIENMDLSSEAYRDILHGGIDFIRSYADRYHHAKEEDILFGYFDKGLDIIKVMLDDHSRARGHVKALLTAIEGGDESGVAFNLSQYGEILSEHIKKEDEILYIWMDRNLTTSQVGEMFSRFNQVDEELKDSGEKYRNFIEGLENKFEIRR